VAACGLRRSSTTADPVVSRLRRSASGMRSGRGRRPRSVSRLALYSRMHSGKWVVLGGRGCGSGGRGRRSTGVGRGRAPLGRWHHDLRPYCVSKQMRFGCFNSAHLGAMSWPRCLHSHAGLFVCRGTRVLLPEFVRHRDAFFFAILSALFAAPNALLPTDQPAARRM
jgi:hypothetical protein